LYPASNLVGKVGFMSSIQELYENPTYEEVCSGKTSLVEVYQMEYLESKKNEMEMYKRLVWHYFSFHDPTTSNRQGVSSSSQTMQSVDDF
jgi:peptide-methionine (S)-S-oxide reductase